MHRLISFLFLVLAAACQPMPHPFAANRPPPGSPLLSPRDSAGIFVRPVAGAPAPAAAALAEAMAAALCDRQIPASTRGRNKGSYQLVAAARDEPLAAGGSALVVDWELRTADDRSLGHVSASGDAASIAATAAPGIARLLQDEPPAMAAADPAIAVRPVTGAPGDGGRALTRAMDYALRQVQVTVADPPDRESLVLTGTVAVAPRAAGQQQVTVHWTLLRPDGGQIGAIDQQNAVPAGSLDGAWGDVAYAVAAAAAPGIAALIARAKASATGS